MMKDEIIEVDPAGNKLAGLQVDLLQKIRNKKITLEDLGWFVKLSPKKLSELRGKAQKQFGRLLKIVPDVFLEATAFLNTHDFFKTKDQGGIFTYVDNDIFNRFDSEVKNSSAKELASYVFTEDITEENIIADAKTGSIYEEVDFAHIKQICERHIVKGEKLLRENSKANLFWVRNKKDELCEVLVCLDDDGWDVVVGKFDASDGWDAGDGSFFRN